MPHDGIKPTAHFAHKADAACSGETALHKAAKAAIVDAHGRGTLRGLEWECPRCKRSLHVTDLRSLVLREETSPCAGVVSDVLGLDSNLDGAEPRVAIEVVVSHDLEAETLARYRAQGLAVFSLRPSWGIVGDLVRGADALRVDHRLGVVDETTCEGCQQVLREKREWEARVLAQRAQAWWSAWIALWKSLGSEVTRRDLFDQQQQYALRLRSLTWWATWSRVWPRIADDIVSTWWAEWRQMWRELGAEYGRLYVWFRTWRAAWSAIGKQYAQEVAERDRRRAEVMARESARRWSWWPTWLQVWSNIGQRASGMMAAWRPICRQCRQDLTADHRCP